MTWSDFQYLNIKLFIGCGKQYFPLSFNEFIYHQTVEGIFCFQILNPNSHTYVYMDCWVFVAWLQERDCNFGPDTVKLHQSQVGRVMISTSRSVFDQGLRKGRLGVGGLQISLSPRIITALPSIPLYSRRLSCSTLYCLSLDSYTPLMWLSISSVCVCVWLPAGDQWLQPSCSPERQSSEPLRQSGD